jgi:hypothetical protein
MAAILSPGRARRQVLAGAVACSERGAQRGRIVHALAGELGVARRQDARRGAEAGEQAILERV